MKKLSITMLLFLSVITINAQDFAFGVKGGVNLASVGGSAYVGLGGLGSKVSFHVGGVAEIPISEKLAIQPELLYSSQGTKWNLFGSGSNLKLDYINMPILAKYYFIEGLSAEAGPVIGYLLSTNDVIENYKSIDVAFGIGAAYKLNENIFFSLRYNKGIMDINNDTSLDGTNQNNVLQLSVGYAF